MLLWHVSLVELLCNGNDSNLLNLVCFKSQYTLDQTNKEIILINKSMDGCERADVRNSHQAKEWGMPFPTRQLYISVYSEIWDNYRYIWLREYTNMLD